MTTATMNEPAVRLPDAVQQQSEWDSHAHTGSERAAKRVR
jgi:hypothetical protein